MRSAFYPSEPTNNCEFTMTEILNKPHIFLDAVQFLEKLKNDEWVKIGSWSVPNIAHAAFDASISSYCFKQFGINVGPITYFRCFDDTYISRNDQAKTKNILSDWVARKKKHNLMWLIRRQNRLIHDIGSKVLNLSTYEPEFMGEALSEVWRGLAFLTPAFELDRAMSDVLDDAISLRFKELGISGVAASELLNSDHESDSMLFNRRLNSIRKSIQSGDVKRKSKFFHEVLNDLVSRFSYLGYYQFVGDGYTQFDIEEMIDQANEIVEDRFQSRTFDDEKINYLVELVNLYSGQRLRRVEAMNKAYFDMRSFIGKYLAATSTTERRFRNFTLEQLFSWFISPELVPGYDVEHSRSASLSCDNNVYFSTDEEANIIYAKFVEKEYGEINQLSGQVGNYGDVSARACVVVKEKDFEDFREGDVLICNMTDPNHLPLMRKSSAFVTDKGGILCHAAIVARELRKPCVIGTVNATKVFRTGDMVRVFANEGLIERIGTIK